MIYVPPGYGYGKEMLNTKEVRGGSAWGAGTFADFSWGRQPTEAELGFAEHQVQQHCSPGNCGMLTYSWQLTEAKLAAKLAWLCQAPCKTLMHS